MEPQGGMEVTILFSVEVQDRMGVTGGRVDPGLWSWVEKYGGLGSQVAESEAKEQEAGPEN